MSTAVDHLLQRLRTKKSQQKLPMFLGRFLVTKQSWRGSYRRILCITHTSIITQFPESHAVTNTWSFVGDAELLSIEVGPERPDGGLVIFHLKSHKGLGGNDAKFICSDRTGLLTVLYQAIGAASARGISNLGPGVLGPPATMFHGHKLKKGKWVPVVLQVGPTAIERFSPGSPNQPRWRFQYSLAGSPAARLLSSGRADEGLPPHGELPFALFSHAGRAPRVYSVKDRDGLLKCMQMFALKLLGIAIAIDAAPDAPSGERLLKAVASAERERAAQPGEAPIGEWEVVRVREDSTHLDASLSRAVVHRRLVLTPTALLERRQDDYEVADRRQLGALAALVRYIEDPQWLGIEWADGAELAVYVTPARDAVIASILDAAQANAGRPIPVLIQGTTPGETISARRGLTPFVGPATAIESDLEIEKYSLAVLHSAAKEFLAAGGSSLSIAALALADFLTQGEHSADVFSNEPHGIADFSKNDSPRSVASSSGHSEPSGLAKVFSRRDLGTDNSESPLLGGASTIGGTGGITTATSIPSRSKEAVCGALQQRIREFCACIPYTGISLSTKMDEAIVVALLCHLPRQRYQSGPPSSDEAKVIIFALQALTRLASAPAVGSQIVAAPGGCARVFAALLCGHDHVACEAGRLLLRLMAPASARQGAPPCRLDGQNVYLLNNSHEDSMLARSAKLSCFVSSARCELLTYVLKQQRTVLSPLVTMAVAEILVAVLCEPGVRNTELSTQDCLLAEVSGLGKPLFSMFSHPSKRVSDEAAVLMRAVAQSGSISAEPMRAAALTEGAFLGHLVTALMAGSKAGVSRELIALWSDGFQPAVNLLKRIFPPGLMRFLLKSSPVARTPQSAAAQPVPSLTQAPEPSISVKAGEQQQQQQQSTAVRPPIATAQLQAIGSGETRSKALPSHIGESQPQFNTDTDIPSQYLSGFSHRPRAAAYDWAAFWSAVEKDHAHAGLVWNERTRAEVCEALREEEVALRRGRARVADGIHSERCRPSWNFYEFSVTYPSLEQQLIVAGVHVKLLVDGNDTLAVKKLECPSDFFKAAHLLFLTLGDTNFATAAAAAAENRDLLVRAMTAVYAAHAGAIGPFDGISYVLALLDGTPSRSLRQRLLQFVSALVQSTVQGGEEKRLAILRANGDALVSAGAVPLLCDMVASGHESSEKSLAAVQASGLIMSSSFEQESSIKEWFYYESAAGGGGGGGGTAQRRGPISKVEIRQLFSRGTIDLSTQFWAENMDEPLPVQLIRELRWWVARGIEPMTPSQAAALALQTLLALAQLRPATEEDDGYLLPSPAVQRQLLSPRNLSRVAQSLLTGDPSIVSKASLLLVTLARQNASSNTHLGALQRTGVHFFALAYCGSNTEEMSSLLSVIHLRQRDAHTSHPASCSILGGLLPESLLFVLDSYGPNAFAKALVGECDSPELIWTTAMRTGRLIPQMLRHLGTFPRRLTQRWSLCYDYTPCPPIDYPEIEGEVWCHRYYLRHLCDQVRFSDWPIKDHIPLLQALLEEWRDELVRKPLVMSEAQACQALGIEFDGENGDLNEETLKGAYRRLARKYHPDKNPEGRDRFLSIQAAYDRLKAGAAGGQGVRPWRVLLLLQGQCILFRRYPEVLEPFKYAGYPMLLQAISDAFSSKKEEDEKRACDDTHKVPRVEEHFLSADIAPRLQTAVELVWLTCACSHLNGEELTRSGGVGLLGELLSRCVSVLSLDAPLTDPATGIATSLLRALAVMARFEVARFELEKKKGVVKDVVHCTALRRAHPAVDAALLFIGEASISPTLQEAALEAAALGHLIPLLLGYDPTHEMDSDLVQNEGNGLPTENDTEFPPIFKAAAAPPHPASSSSVVAEGRHEGMYGSEQSAKNQHAILAVRALSALAGLNAEDPTAKGSNGAVYDALSALLTPALVRRLALPDPRPLLQDMNTSLMTPQVVWNNAMREELLEAAESQKICPDVRAASQHTFKAIQGELVIAGVFVRVYNEQPSFSLADPNSFCKGLVTYLHSQERQAPPGSEGKRNEEHILAAVTALQHVLEAAPRLLGLLATKQAQEPIIASLSPAIEAGHRSAALWPASPLSDGFAPEAATAALYVLLRMAAHGGCLETMSQEKVVMSAFWLVHRPPTLAILEVALRLLLAVASSPAAAWGAACQGGVFYLLSILLPAFTVDNDQERGLFETCQVITATLLSRLMVQSLHGQRVALLLGRLLPPGLVAAVHDGPGEVALSALTQPSETPERLWTKAMRSSVVDEVDSLANSARLAQCQRPASLDWAPPDGTLVQHSCLNAGEDSLYVGGVYVGLFLKDPQYPLRNPKGFLEGLLDEYISTVQSSTPQANLGSPIKSGVSTTVRSGAAAAPATEGSGRAITLSAAAVALLQYHPSLADHAVGLGYVEKCIRLLGARVPAPSKRGGGVASMETSEALLTPDEVAGSLLRFIHKLALATTAAETLARCSPPAVPILISSMRWGSGAAVLALEALKRALAPENRGRDILVGSCLRCGLVDVLLTKLEWRRPMDENLDEAAASAQNHVQQRDEAVLRVLYVDILNLLSIEGAYSEKVMSVLDGSEVWAAFRGRRHDLFLPAGGMESAGGVAGLLKGPSAARFALPAMSVSDTHTGGANPPADHQPAAVSLPLAVEEVPISGEADEMPDESENFGVSLEQGSPNEVKLTASQPGNSPEYSPHGAAAPSSAAVVETPPPPVSPPRVASASTPSSPALDAFFTPLSSRKMRKTKEEEEDDEDDENKSTPATALKEEDSDLQATDWDPLQG